MCFILYASTHATLLSFFPFPFLPSGDTLPISVILAVASYFPWPPLTSLAYNSLRHLTFTIHLAYNYTMPSTVT